MSKFNREMFAVAFAASIDALAQSEHVTKRELMHLSRSVLEATHETGDIQYVNKLIAILTPVNKKVAIVFFRHFTGFSFDDKLAMFTKKSKKRYAEAFVQYVQFLADPHNNIWTWAARNIEIEQKEFDLKKVTDYVRNAMKKAPQVDIMKAVIAAGITAETIIAIMGEVGLEADVKEELPQE
jgi:ubiquinone biosynthesis protein UbiJ